MDAFETINDTLVNLFNEILKLEEEAIITGEFSDITNNDMHIIEAIGLSGKSTMSPVSQCSRSRLRAEPQCIAPHSTPKGLNW